MDEGKRKLLKLSLIVLSTTLVRVVLQAFMPSGSSNPLPPSSFAQSGFLPAAFTVFGLVTFGLLAAVFLLIQGGMPGSRMKKGLVFGLSFGAMWAAYLVEPVPHVEGLALPEVLSYPVADGTTILLMGLLLGRFIASDAVGQEKAKALASSRILAPVVISMLFLAGRLAGYGIFHIYSSFQSRPFATVIWAAATGLWIGIMYMMLCPGDASQELKSAEKPITLKAAYFGFLIYGIDLICFNLFMPLVFDFKLWPVGSLLSYADLAMRTAIDIVSVTAGVFISLREFEPVPSRLKISLI